MGSFHSKDRAAQAGPAQVPTAPAASSPLQPSPRPEDAPVNWVDWDRAHQHTSGVGGVKLLPASVADPTPAVADASQGSTCAAVPPAATPVARRVNTRCPNSQAAVRVCEADSYAASVFESPHNFAAEVGLTLSTGLPPLHTTLAAPPHLAERTSLRKSQSNSDKELRQVWLHEGATTEELREGRQLPDEAVEELRDSRIAHGKTTKELKDVRRSLGKAEQELRESRQSHGRTAEELIQLRRSHGKVEQDVEQLRQSQRAAAEELRLVGLSKHESDQKARKLRQELQQWQGEPVRLHGMTAIELEGVLHGLEGSTERVRRALEQALVDEASRPRFDEELLCPVCLDHRKDTVFQCGHQTCSGCSGKVHECPICRVPVVQRIRVF